MIAAVTGRLDDAFRYPAGATVHPVVFRHVLGEAGGVDEYQVRQRPGGDIAAIELSLAEELERVGLPDPVVRVTLVDELRRDERTGKLRRFVPL